MSILTVGVALSGLPFYGIFVPFFRRKEGKEVLLIMKMMKKEIVKIMEDYKGEFRKKYNDTGKSNGFSPVTLSVGVRTW